MSKKKPPERQYPDQDGLFPDSDRQDGVGNDDQGLNPDTDRDDGVQPPERPATSIGAQDQYGNRFDDDATRQPEPGEVLYRPNGDVVIGAPAAVAGVKSFPQ